MNLEKLSKDSHNLPHEERIKLLMEELAEAGPDTIKNKELPEECLKRWSPDGPGYQRRIVSAANRFYDKETGEELIIASARHYSPAMARVLDFIKKRGVDFKMAYGDNQGFIDQFDDYHTREEAIIIARYANQLHYEKCGSEYELFSEDLYQ